MRLLKLGRRGELGLTKDIHNGIPPYVIFSHTWGKDDEEVTFDDLQTGHGKSKVGYRKIQFCGKQARKDGIEYFWVDTCCIDKANYAELSEAITSMFRWYRDAARYYVYLPDVSTRQRRKSSQNQPTWELAFRQSRWFKRGWTLQELLAPKSVDFFSREEELLGDKKTLERQIHEITDIPATALYGCPLSDFSVEERLGWATKRETTREEDKAYCLLGIFGIYMLPIYGEKENAFVRLQDEIDKRSGSLPPANPLHWMVTRPTNPLFTGRKDVLYELEGTVRDAVKKPPDQRQCRIVISGMGGQGKSEVCLQLAYRLRSLFWAVLWIDVSTTDLTERSIVDGA